MADLNKKIPFVLVVESQSIMFGSEFQWYIKDKCKLRSEVRSRIPLKRIPTEKEIEVLKDIIDWSDTDLHGLYDMRFTEDKVSEV